MKKLVLNFAVGIILFSFCSKDEVLVPLSDQEKSDLIFLREEEKLARDVYHHSFVKYGQSTFNNISGSEQAHMTSVLTLFEKYNLSDPVTNNDYGVFVSQDLQQLYNTLVAKSDSSLTDALEVGALIEDLDLHDIDQFKAHTTKVDLIEVYEKLSCGSRNHLRSFVGQLGSYQPLYINQSQYDLIIGANNEQCGF